MALDSVAVSTGRQYIDVGRHTLVTGEDEIVTRFVDDLIAWGGDFPDDAKAIGVLSDSGALIAGMVFTDYQPKFGTIQISMGATTPAWARKETIRGLLDYPFIQLGLYKCWMQTPHNQAHVIKTSKHFGFKQEGILAHAFGKGVHAWMGRMLRPDFDRLYGKYG